MAEITIEVRSPFQRMLLDTLWQFDTYEQCLKFRDTLPTQQQREICDNMIQLMIAAVIDQQVDSEADCALARNYLSS